MNYRILPADEWSRLDGIALKLDGPIPPEYLALIGMATCAVAENEKGQIVGILFLQPALHMEPLAIDPNHRGAVDFRKLAGVLDEHLVEALNGVPTEYFIFTPDKKVGRMAQIHGMTQRPYRVWSKMVSGNGGE